MHATRFAPGLALAGAIVAIAYALHGLAPALSPLSMSVGLGILVANLGRIPNAFAPGIAFSGRRVLRVGVALLGMELSLRTLQGLGGPLLLSVVLVVVATIFGVTGLSRLLKVPMDLGLLIGVGYGICGASAIAAAKSQTRATEEEASYAVALVAICGTLSIAVLPIIGSWIGLGDVLFGRWAGAAVHDVGQVVATASTRSDAALHAAIVVKLARVALLAPVVVLLSLRARRLELHADGTRPPLLPLFVIGFIALAAVNSLGVVPAAIASSVVTTSKVLMSIGLAALGLNVRWQDLRRVGGRPLLLGMLAWVLVAGVALLAVTVIGV